jgi:signal transduction histidine kinase
MDPNLSTPHKTIKPGSIGLIAVYFSYAAVVIRTLALEVIRPRLPVYLVLELLFVILFTVMLWRPASHQAWEHLYFVFQCLIVLVLLALRPQFDLLVVLFVGLSFQAALVFSGRTRWVWVTIILVLTGLPLTIALGVRGLAVALLPMTAVIVFPAFVAVTQEIEAGQRRRQALLTELREANQRLTAYTSQVEELASIQERNRLARELHDSVSQTMFSIGLHSQAVRILVERDPERLRPQLEQLQKLIQNALEEMRGLIADLRRQGEDSDKRPKF